MKLIKYYLKLRYCDAVQGNESQVDSITFQSDSLIDTENFLNRINIKSSEVYIEITGIYRLEGVLSSCDFMQFNWFKLQSTKKEESSSLYIRNVDISPASTNLIQTLENKLIQTIVENPVLKIKNVGLSPTVISIHNLYLFDPKYFFTGYVQ